MNRLAPWGLALLLGSSMALQAGTKLSKAASSDDAAGIKALLLNPNENINDIDSEGWTALMWAAFYNQGAALACLLEHGADPNLKSTMEFRSFPAGTTALGLAAYYAHDTHVALLMSAKADPQAVDARGLSPLNYAEGSNCIACVSLMRGVNPPPSSLHSSKHPVVKTPLDSIFIVLDSSLSKPQAFLARIQTELDAALEKRHLRHAICAMDPGNPASAKEVAAKREAFKPRYLLDWTQIAIEPGTASNTTKRVQFEFRADLYQCGDFYPIWVNRIPTSQGSSADATDDPKTMNEVQALLKNLESDLLLQP